STSLFPGSTETRPAIQVICSRPAKLSTRYQPGQTSVRLWIYPIIASRLDPILRQAFLLALTSACGPQPTAGGYGSTPHRQTACQTWRFMTCALDRASSLHSPTGAALMS